MNICEEIDVKYGLLTQEESEHFSQKRAGNVEMLGNSYARVVRAHGTKFIDTMIPL
jgi:hypothetical protein